MKVRHKIYEVRDKWDMVGVFTVGGVISFFIWILFAGMYIQDNGWSHYTTVITTLFSVIWIIGSILVSKIRGFKVTKFKHIISKK